MYSGLWSLQSALIVLHDTPYVSGRCNNIETADDLDDLVQDKREGWRANPSKARRRQRRYKKRLTNELLRMDHLNED